VQDASNPANHLFDFFPLANVLGVLKPEEIGLKTVFTHRP